MNKQGCIVCEAVLAALAAFAVGIGLYAYFEMYP